MELFDAANVSAFYKLDLDRLSVVEQWVRPKQGGALKRLARFEYRDATKSLKSSIDLWDAECTFTYEEAQGRPRASNFKSMSGPGGRTTYTYHLNNLVRTLLDAWGGTTTYEYDIRGNLTKAILPFVPTAVSLAHDQDQSHEIVWKYDEEKRLTESINELGFHFFPEYGGPEDPGPAGLWTRGRREVVAGETDETETLNDA
ncbi:MAG: hypothetical protein ND866_09530 [Pyrinomonadaceae bacterium]|nr:hypothetical protein [Pyrinomonadaceae bacterium]